MVRVHVIEDAGPEGVFGSGGRGGVDVWGRPGRARGCHCCRNFVPNGDGDRNEYRWTWWGNGRMALELIGRTPGFKLRLGFPKSSGVLLLAPREWIRELATLIKHYVSDSWI